MRMGSKLVSAALSLVFLPLGIQAQEVDTTSFNALEYSMQKRYRPRNEAFVSENSWTILFCVREWVLWACSAIPCQVILRDRQSQFQSERCLIR